MNLISKVSLIAALSSSAVAFAGTHLAPNCDVSGKKVHVKGKAQCEKKKGTFIDEKASEAKSDVKPGEQKTDTLGDQKAPAVPETK